MIARYNKYFKLDGYHKESKLGYRNNRGTRRRRCIPVFPSFARRYVTLERCGIPRRISQTPRRLTFFSEPIPRRIMALSLWLAFPPLRRWQAPRPLHKLHEGEARAPFTIFHEEVTGTPTKPTRRSPSKSNKLTVSHSNKSWWRAQHYERMQSKNTKGLPNPSHLNSTKATSAREELEMKNNGGGQPMTPRSRSQEFPSLRGGIDWWGL